MKCVVCDDRETSGPRGTKRTALLLCATCGKSYDGALRKDLTVAGVLVWAARRARGFERRRKSRQKKRPLKAHGERAKQDRGKK